MKGVSHFTDEIITLTLVRMHIDQIWNDNIIKISLYDARNSSALLGKRYDEK
ncbi:MAG: hypothetical protein P8Y79_15935 [Ignavibacteriaceae bacterium]